MSNDATPAIPAPLYDPVRNLGRVLVDAAAQMSRAVDRRAQAFGVSGAQWVILIRIGGGIGNTASELCRTIGYDSGAMTRMLDRLERRGLVRRTPSREDGRAARLSLTPEGEALYPKLVPVAVAVIDEHLRGFSAGEIEQFMGFLDRVIANRAACGDEGAPAEPCATPAPADPDATDGA